MHGVHGPGAECVGDIVLSQLTPQPPMTPAAYIAADLAVLHDETVQKANAILRCELSRGILFSDNPSQGESQGLGMMVV